MEISWTDAKPAELPLSITKILFKSRASLCLKYSLKIDWLNLQNLRYFTFKQYYRNEKKFISNLNTKNLINELCLAQRLPSTGKCFKCGFQSFFFLLIFFLYSSDEFEVTKLVVEIRNSSLVCCFDDRPFLVFYFPYFPIQSNDQRFCWKVQ